MNSERPTPFDDIERAFERMSRQFDDLSRQRDGRPWMGGWTRGAGDSTGVSVDVAEYDDSVVVTADLPGFDRSGIDLRIDGDALTVAAERTREDERASDDGRFVRRERRSSSVRRSIPLPAAVDETAASATYTNGVLTIRLPRLAPDDADGGHRIDVE